MTKTNVMRLLDAAGINYEAGEYEVDEDDLSGSHAADMMGMDHDTMFKTLVLKGDKNGYLVCCIPVDEELDLKKVAKASKDKKVEMIHMKELLPLTGYMRGGCSPIGMKKKFPTYIEETAQIFDKISISAGQRGVQVILNPEELAKYVDVMIGNEEDFTACLGFEVEGNDADLKELNMDGYVKMLGEVCKAYPNFKVIATTLRTVITATVNSWKAICYADGKIYHSIEFPALEILDRVGGGDSFASGLIYGLMTYEDAQKAVNYGAVHGALAMTTPGDTSMASLKEVEAKVNGGSARVQR